MQIRVPRPTPERRRAQAKRGPRRLGLKTVFTSAAAILALVLSIYVWVATGSAAGAREGVRKVWVNVMANAGFRLENIYVEGRTHLEADTLKAIINMKRGDPLFAFDPDTAHTLLARVPWVKKVVVRRDLPDTIYISLVERTPIALWQQDEKVRVIDPEGVVVTTDLRPFSALPLVVGKNANRVAAQLLSDLSAEPELIKRLDNAVWIGERRWDLNLKGGIQIRLPEDEVGLAIKRLADTHRNDDLFNKDLLVIDAREDHRLVIRTRGNVVQDYQASFKPTVPGQDL